MKSINKRNGFRNLQKAMADLKVRMILSVTDSSRHLTNQRGAIGIKEIAITVAVIVIIAALTVIMKDNAPDWVTQIWDLFIEKIEDLIQ